MNTTTPQAIRADAITQIRAITPSYTPQSGRTWTYVANTDPEGANLRTYTINMTPAIPVEDGWYGDGLEYAFELQIVTSYRGVRSDDLDAMITADGIDLWNALRPRDDPDLPGVFNWIHETFEDGTESEEHFWGVHVFTVSYKAATSYSQ